MIVVLPVCQKDEHLALLNLELCKRLDGRVPFDCLVTFEEGFDASHVIAMAQGYFRGVFRFCYPHCPWQVVRWETHNWAWQQSARAVLGFRPESWLWWEQDAVPLRSLWLTQIADAATAGKQPFAGSVVRQGVIHHPYMAGVAVYPPNLNQIAPAALSVRDTPFDLCLSLIDQIMPRVTDIGGIIHHQYQADGGGWNATLPIPNAALYHRCKDGSLVKAVQAQLGKVPHPNLIHNTCVSTVPDSGSLLNGWTPPAKSSKNLFTEATISEPAKHGILFISPQGNSGYGEIAKARLAELALGDTPVHWRPLTVDNSSTDNSALARFCNTLAKGPLIKYDVAWALLTPENWAVQFQGIPSTCKRIGETIWETDRLHPDWVKYLNSVDEVVASTKWNKQIFQDSGVTTPVIVRPYVWPREELPAKDVCHMEGVEKDDFVFYTIGQWTARKGITETIQAFCNTFTSRQRVVLIVKTFWQQYAADSMAVCRNRVNHILSKYKHPPRIVLSLTNHTRQQMLALHSLGDCYVSLCKSEGLGLGALDADRFGKSVIITGWGGQVECLGENYPGLVKYKMVPVSGMEWIKAYRPDQNWAEPDMDHARELLKVAYRKGKL